jgi:divalent metal cation (Fe/Co/Zn/Cd) transporter
MQQPDDIPQVHIVALWVALAALVIKELLFRYMLAVATRVKSTMLVANAWHARSDAASSLVVAIGIIGSLSGFKLLDPVAALVVGLIVTRMGYSFMSDSLHDLMDRAVDIETENSIKTHYCPRLESKASMTSRPEKWETLLWLMFIWKLMVIYQ